MNVLEYLPDWISTWATWNKVAIVGGVFAFAVLTIQLIRRVFRKGGVEAVRE